MGKAYFGRSFSDVSNSGALTLSTFRGLDTYRHTVYEHYAMIIVFSHHCNFSSVFSELSASLKIR